MAKNGFGGQWIEISSLGNWRDSAGAERNINADFIQQVIANFTPRDAPAVVGHPKENAPAFGWATAIRLNGDKVEVQFADTDDEFERLVREGKYRKRSASFYLEPPRLRHVGFLGAQPPAIKGLREISFNDGGETVTVETSFSEEKQMSKENETTEEKKTIKEWFKEVFGGGQQPVPVPANFSEADAQKLVADAVKAAKEEVKAEFTEKFTAVENENKALKEQVGKITDSGTSSSIASFVESLPAESGKHFLKRAGVTEFLESLAAADAADKEPAICFSEGEGDKKVEHKFSRLDWAKEFLKSLPKMMEFGEKFASIKVTKEAEKITNNPQRLQDMRDEMGIKKDGGEK